MGNWNAWISGQIAASLDAITDAVAKRDVYLLADHVTLFVHKCKPILSKMPQERQQEIDPPELVLPQADKDLTTEAKRLRVAERALFRDCMIVMGNLLVILAENGLYANQQSAFDGSTNAWAIGAEAADVVEVNVVEDP